MTARKWVLVLVFMLLCLPAATLAVSVGGGPAPVDQAYADLRMLDYANPFFSFTAVNGETVTSAASGPLVLLFGRAGDE